MKRLPLVILALGIMLVAVVAGCGRTPRYDGRLVAADSLMRSVPDSALAIVQDVCRDSLAAEGDRAYRDLLLTQARYRCYVTATSDSDINRALAYYLAHSSEREKLTRAYIFKGAVMEELGYPDSAMLYYKHAEAEAASDDYFNLGYVKMRMGTLYRDYYSMDGYDIQKYEEALECFMQTNKKHYQLVCGIDLASLHRLNNEQKAQDLLTESMSLAMQLKDTINYAVCIKSLIGLYYYHGRFEQGRELSQVMMKDYSNFIDHEFCYNASKIYSKSRMPDSARFFLNLVGCENYGKPLHTMSYIECLSELALAEKDTLEHLRLEKEFCAIEDSLMANGQKQHILAVENEFDKAARTRIHTQQNKRIFLMTCFILLAALFAAALFYHNKHRYDRLINELKMESQNHISDINTLKQNIDQLKIRDNQLKDFITSHMGMMREMIDECYRGANVKQIKHTIEEIVRFQKGNNSQWLKLFSYIDAEYGNIMSITKHNYPLLSDKELLLLALTTLNCSCIQIATILGYSNISSVGPIRQRLAKKMQLDGSLNQYIQQFKPI